MSDDAVESNVLGRVTRDLDAARGPDLIFSIEVPAEWLEGGAELEVTLPRNLSCAACEGGGCDACDRAGALCTRERDAPPRVVTLYLPASATAVPLKIRVPEAGAPSHDESLGPGHLLVVVRPVSGADRVPSAGVRRVLSAALAASASEERSRIARQSVVLALVLVLTFLGMLRLSGWL